MMELRFATADLQQNCGARQARVNAYGADRAAALARRLAQLDAIETLDDLHRLPFDWSVQSDGSFLVCIVGRLHLHLRAVLAHGRHLEALEVIDIFEEEE